MEFLKETNRTIRVGRYPANEINLNNIINSDVQIMHISCHGGVNKKKMKTYLEFEDQEKICRLK